MVPEFFGVLRCRIPRGGDRFWTVFGQVLGGFETGIFFEIAIIRWILGYLGRIWGGLRDFEAGWRDLGGKSQDLGRILKILENKKGF